MRRRAFLTVSALALAGPILARAQQASRRIGWLGFARNPEREAAFTDRLRQLGSIQGRDYEIEFRTGEAERMPTLAEELATLRPTVIVAGNSVAALAAKQALPSTPIIVGAAYDLVSLGLASSYARPDGNVTGIVAGWDAVIGKQLELGFELMPGRNVAGMLLDAASLVAGPYRLGAEKAAGSKGATVHFAEVRAPVEIEAALDALSRHAVSLVIVQPSPMFLAERVRIAELALAHRLPIVCAFREHAEAGGLMSYGTDLRENFRHVAVYVDKVFRGAKVAELPIQEPTKFELVLNLKVARALGLTIPPTLLARADEVIE